METSSGASDEAAEGPAPRPPLGFPNETGFSGYASSEPAERIGPAGEAIVATIACISRQGTRMSEPLTEPYEPRNTNESYDWDYEDERRGPKILWGRVAALGLALIVAFLLGRFTAGGDGDSDQVAALRQELTETQDDLQAARDELAAQDEPTATPSPTAEQTPADTEGEEATGTTYTVRPNDTLRDIAERYYQDVTLDDCIAEANGITDPLSIRPGQELDIPEEADCA